MNSTIISWLPQMIGVLHEITVTWAFAQYERELLLSLTPVPKKTHSATYIKPGKGLSLNVDDIGRQQLLTQPQPGRHLPVVSA